MANKKYSVEIKEVYGSMENPVFKKMAERGDITSTKLDDMIGATVKITGYALCHIDTEDKSFDMVYYSTDSGIISSGSEIFLDSVKSYLEDKVERFNIVKIKTSKGSTYKVSPVLEMVEEDV